MTKLRKNDLDKKRDGMRITPGDCIRVGMSSCGLAAGALEVYQTLLKESKERSIPVEVRKCGCQGMCYAEPLVEVTVEGMPRVIYGRVTRDVAVKILEKHVCNKMLVNDHIFDLTV